MNKYVYKPYREIFPALFAKEKARLASALEGILVIEHVGSTAIPSLGGKGIIDIAITAKREDVDFVSLQIQSLGYEFRPTYSTPDRYYFVSDLPDPEEGTRRYHVHLTYPGSRDWEGLISFRDYLRAHPEAVQEYAVLKQRAALEADHAGDKYRKIKEPMFKKINARIKQGPISNEFSG